MPEPSPPRFYGRRKGRPLRPTAKAALKDRLQTLLFDPEKDKAFLDASCHECWLEIGFGSGEHFLSHVKQHPLVHFLGIEPYENGVATLVKNLHPEELHQVRLFPNDVRLCIEKLSPETFSRVFILFPDPWPKKRHAKRRLIQSAFLDQLAGIVRTSGQLRFASDDLNYIAWAKALVDQHPAFSLLHQERVTTLENWPTDWPKTRYGEKALKEKKPCVFLIYERR